MQLSFSNATILLEQVDREVILDCSVHGIGIGAGNLNTEIILEYLNENYQGQYNDRNILEINDQFIENIYADKLLLNPGLYLKKNETYYIMCRKGTLSRKVVRMLTFYGYDVVLVKNF